MKLSEAPYKLTNDGLCDVIIKMEYKPLFSRESLETQIIDSLNNLGLQVAKYTMRDSSSRSENERIHFLATENYKILVNDNSLSFNIVNAYRGWTDYLTFIKNVLKVYSDYEFTNISIRYVSQFDDMNIFRYLDRGIDLKTISKLCGSELNFRYADDTNKEGIAFVDVKVLNNRPHPTKQGVFLSNLLIDVKTQANNTWIVESMLEALKMIRKVEWKAFVSLLKKEFFIERGALWK